MPSFIKKLQKVAEFITAAMLAAIFITFLVQIVSRRVSDQPIGWTVDLCLALWVWIVFFGGAFIVRNKEQVTFDILYILASKKMRKLFAMITAAAIFVAFVWSYLPTFDYINWMQMKRSGTLGVSMRPILIVYMVFLTAAIIRYGWKFYEAARHGSPDCEHMLTIEEGEDLKSHKHKENA